ncbi:hypothetical protein FM112_03295 [Gulosibacter sp. 10]|nr:hypothetical protein FM112_03295 [Gulosibacter sp. 10]
MGGVLSHGSPYGCDFLGHSSTSLVGGGPVSRRETLAQPALDSRGSARVVGENHPSSHPVVIRGPDSLR